MRVKVSELVGASAYTPQDGLRLYEIIEPALGRGEPIELDFADVRRFSPGFFATAVGPLIERDTTNRLTELLRYENLEEIGQIALGLVIDHWTRRREIPGWGAAWDAAVQQRSEEAWD